MIKITHIYPSGPAQLDLTFSDGTTAHWSADALISRNTELTAPVVDPAYFNRAFIEAGALAWPNGLELSASALHEKLDQMGALDKIAA